MGNPLEAADLNDSDIRKFLAAGYVHDVLCGLFILLFPLFTFFGQAYFHSVVGAAAFFGGAYGGYLLTLGVSMSALAGAAVILLSGVLAGALALKLEKLGWFCLGSVGALLVSNTAYQFIAAHTHLYSDVLHYAVTVALSLAGGLLVLWLEDPLECVLTALAGSYMGAAGADYLLYRFHQVAATVLWPEEFFKNARYFECSDEVCYILMAAWAFFFVAGATYQVRAKAERARESRECYALAGYERIPSGAYAF